MPEPDPGAGTVTSAPGNSAPERDARGIPVISDPADVPAGFNQPAQVGGTGVAPGRAPGAAARDRELSGLLAHRHRQLRAGLRARRAPPAALGRRWTVAASPF